MLNNMFLFLADLQQFWAQAYFFLQKDMVYSKNIHIFAAQKHKVIEEFLNLSSPEAVIWIFLERRPQSFAQSLGLGFANSGRNKLSFKWIA